MQGSVRAVRQAWVHGPGLVGRVHHLVKALIHHQRQALPAYIRVAAERGPASFDIFGIGFLETIGGFDTAGSCVVSAAFGVATDVERKDYLGGKLATFFQYGVDGVSIQIRMARNGLEVVHDMEYFVQDELHVAQGWGIGGHGLLLDRFH